MGFQDCSGSELYVSYLAIFTFQEYNCEKINSFILKVFALFNKSQSLCVYVRARLMAIYRNGHCVPTATKFSIGNLNVDGV